MLDVRVSASMIKQQEVLTDQQHKGGDTCEKTETSEDEAQGRLDRSGRPESEARRGFARKRQPRDKQARSQRQTAIIPKELVSNGVSEMHSAAEYPPTGNLSSCFFLFWGG